MEIEDIRIGDIITYRSGRTNNVNKPYKYGLWYNKQFKHIKWGKQEDIMKIRRYVKFLCFYRLKTIYERVENE